MVSPSGVGSVSLPSMSVTLRAVTPNDLGGADKVSTRVDGVRYAVVNVELRAAPASRVKVPDEPRRRSAPSVPELISTWPSLSKPGRHRGGAAAVHDERALVVEQAARVRRRSMPFVWSLKVAPDWLVNVLPSNRSIVPRSHPVRRPLIDQGARLECRTVGTAIGQPQIEAALGHCGSRAGHGAVGPGQESADVERVRPGQGARLPLVRFRLATVMVVPVLKLTTPESIVRLPSGPTVLPAVKTTLSPSVPPVSIRVAPLTLYVLPVAEIGRHARAERDRARAADIRAGVEGVRLVVIVVSEQEGRAGVNSEAGLDGECAPRAGSAVAKLQRAGGDVDGARVDEIGLHQGRGRAVGHDEAPLFSNVPGESSTWHRRAQGAAALDLQGGAGVVQEGAAPLPGSACPGRTRRRRRR